MIKRINLDRFFVMWCIAYIIFGGVIITLAYFTIAQVELKIALMSVGFAILGLGFAFGAAQLSSHRLKDIDSKVDIILSSITETKKVRSAKKGDQK